uniref:Small membrane protein n=1 Tax=Bird deltacoronavirus PluvialisCN24 TaxID=3237955 RepID=A0AB39AG16_9NIDO
MVDSSWDITIPGTYVIAALIVLGVCVTLLFINTCLACIKLIYKCYSGALVLFNPIVVYYKSKVPPTTEEFVKVHQFPRNSYV